MKRLLISATFFVAASSTLGLGAGNTPNMNGSLFELSSAIIAACPGTAGPYGGTGSDGGQRAMLAGTQQVAPMSRFLDATTCAGTAAGQAAGLVIGLDAVAIVGSSRTAGSTECNGDDNVTCDPAFETGSGAAYDTAIVGDDGVTYTLSGWRDVLRVLLAGFHHDNIGTGPAQWIRRNCNSAVRRALADNYGAFFENNCSAPAGEAEGDASFSPVCSSIRHIFRRDDFSLATETMVTLLGLPSVVPPEITVEGTLQHTGASPFCSAVRPAFIYAAPGRPTTLQGSDYTWDPTSTTIAVNGRETSVYRATMQDNDPIRRLCAGTGAGAAPAEDVCSHSGDLGLVLTVNDVEELEPHTGSDRYSATPCVRSRIASVSPPEVYDAITQARVICTRSLLCPNGDVCNHFGGCYAPADAAGKPNCLATKLTTPALTSSLLALPVANPAQPARNDGRSYNQHLYDERGAYQPVSQAVGVAVTGAFHRIHAAHSLAPANGEGGITCQNQDMNEQIGCLVRASPCSLGYARLDAASSSPDVAAVKINRQSARSNCMQGAFLYPLAQKLYLNSVSGFASVTGQELQLAGCMTDLAQPGHGPPTPGGLLTASIAAAGLLAIPSSVNDGQPFCEDFDEATLCAAATNVDACGTPGNFDAFPVFETVCGDGQIGPFEDCDDGVRNGPAPAACSSVCRSNH